MNTDKLIINTPDDGTPTRIIIHELSELNELPVLEPLKLQLKGVITCVTEFLSQRKDQPDQINEKRCHILVNREDISIKLVFNENDNRNTGFVEGVLQPHPSFVAFGINDSTKWSPADLGMFFKMNRAFFPDKAINMQLVHDLLHFNATVNQTLERLTKETGDRTDVFKQTVDSNIPKAFTLKIPVFKGTDPETLEVETFAQVNGRDVAFVLLSPAANQLMEDIRDTIIDKEIVKIREMCPSIAIIEQ